MQMQRSRQGRITPTITPNGQAEGRAKQRAFCVAVLEEGEDLSELHELLRTAGVAIVGNAVQHRDQPHPNSYLGPGKLQEVKTAAKEADANIIAVDDELSWLCGDVNNTFEEGFGLGGVKYFAIGEHRHQVPLRIIIRTRIRRAPDCKGDEPPKLVGKELQARRAIATFWKPDAPVCQEI